MDTEEFTKKAKEGWKSFAEASKSAFEKAGDKVQKFTDDTVVKVERNKLDTKRNCKYEELGLKISTMLLDGAEIKTDKAEDLEMIKSIQEEIIFLSNQIKEKDDLLQ